MLIFSVIVVLVATGLSLGAAVVYRRRQLSRRVRLELTNLGNVESRYRVRAEDPQGCLEFQFLLRGSPLATPMLPQPAPAVELRSGDRPAAAQNPYQKPTGALAAADGAMNAGGAIAGFLGTLGLLLPRSIGAPLLQASAQLRRKEIAVARVRAVPTQIGRVSRQVPRPLQRVFRRAPAARAATGKTASAAGALTWAETPPVQPGDTLPIDLIIRSASRLREQHSYRVLSHAVDQEDAPVVSEEGSILFGGGFWARRVAPYTTILVVAALLLLLAFWLASVGVWA